MIRNLSGKCVLSFGLMLSAHVSASAFQAEGYEWEIFNESEVRCDGFIWGKAQKIANIPASVTNTYTQKTYTNTYVYGIHGGATVEEIIVPDTVRQFGDGALRRNSNLKRITLPSFTDMSSLPDYMFEECVSLTELTTPKAHYKFYKEDGTTYYSLGIGEKFCYGCTSLTKVVIPTECFYISFAAFQKCPNLRHFYVYSIEPPYIESDVFFSEEEMAVRSRADESAMTLYVPAESIELYKNSSWSKYFSEIKEAPEYSGITDIASDMDASGPLHVFDLYGRQVGQDIDGLAPGIYIIRQGNNSKKIVVR